MDRGRQQSPTRDVGDEMDSRETIIAGLQRPGDVVSSGAVREQSIENGVEMVGTSVGMGSSGHGNFDNTLREIDSALAAFDKTDSISLQPRDGSSVALHLEDLIMGQGAGAEGFLVVVQDDQRVSVDMENGTSSSVPLRGWKRLARERDVVQVGSPSAGKRSVDECLEGVADLVPTK